MLQELLADCAVLCFRIPHISRNLKLPGVIEKAAVPGVSGLFVGPNDLSIDYGRPGESSTPEMEHAYRAVVEAGRAVGKPTGIITGNMPLIRHCEALVMQLFSCNSEVGLLAKQIKSMIADFRAES